MLPSSFFSSALRASALVMYLKQLISPSLIVGVNGWSFRVHQHHVFRMPHGSFGRHSSLRSKIFPQNTYSSSLLGKNDGHRLLGLHLTEGMQHFELVNPVQSTYNWYPIPRDLTASRTKAGRQSRIVLLASIISHSELEGEKESYEAQSANGSKHSEINYECQYCKTKYSSRNALFRHLRGQEENYDDVGIDCPSLYFSEAISGADAMQGGDAVGGIEKELQLTTAIRYGYFFDENDDVSEEDLRDGVSKNTHENTSNPASEREQRNEIVATQIQESFVNLAHAFLSTATPGTTTKSSNAYITTNALTYSTAAKLRQPSLRLDEQRVGGAASEVLSFNYRLSIPRYSSVSAVQIERKWKKYVQSGRLLKEMQSWLDNKSSEDARSHSRIKLHHMDALVPRSQKFYAERGCSQRSFRYLLPLRWILMGDDANGSDEGMSPDLESQIMEWCKTIVHSASSHSDLQRGHQPRGGHRRDGKASIKVPECILQLKKALKAAESQTQEPTAGGTSEEAAELTSMRLSPGRFGQLWRKERRCWSNFADPTLRGMAASPGHEAVWRTMDQCKIVGFVYHDSNQNELNAGETEDMQDSFDVNGIDDILQNMHAVIEFRGDGFLLGQIPRVIPTVVAMTNGWLPDNFFEVATRPDVHLTTPSKIPSALDGRMYFHAARYHFHELTGSSDVGNTANDGSATMSSTDGGQKEVNYFESVVRPGTGEELEWEVKLRSLLLNRASFIDESIEKEWLSELKNSVSPAVRQQLISIQNENKYDGNVNIINNDKSGDSLEDSAIYTAPPSESFSKTVDLLRNVVDSGKWPSTSGARTRVIKSPTSGGSAFQSKNSFSTKKGAVATSFPGNAISAGSFTVVNQNLWSVDDNIPLGNKMFPALAEAVFQLEKDIVSSSEPPLPSADGMNRQSSSASPRLPSTHCAINRNAQFTPHVDSGRGQGQSLSMIVGLGNYTGGEILVEGKPYDIRYNALEFDGWKQLHWTAPFLGERYSLVWFTPESKESSDVDTVEPVEANEQQLGQNMRGEDQKAIDFAKKHNKAVPSLQPLKFRLESTDALVVNEILNPDGCIYALNSTSCFSQQSSLLEERNVSPGFSVSNHSVLDIGAHIGVFSRYAFEQGCRRIIAYEPEPSNFDILSKNLDLAAYTSTADGALPQIDIHPMAVAMGLPQSRTLVQARNQNDGTQNTWRHSLEEYSQYVDRSTKLPSESQKGQLDRFAVSCVPFFSDGDVEGALVPGITFVKLDCEGSEIEILLSNESSKSSSWLDVTHLVFEWSFTKERRVKLFHKALLNLKEAGFELFYEGMGSWWDTDTNVLWPFPRDLVVFAIKNKVSV